MRTLDRAVIAREQNRRMQTIAELIALPFALLAAYCTSSLLDQARLGGKTFIAYML